MAFSLLSAAATLLVAFYIYKLFTFLRFYRHARRTGFPVFVSPIFSKSIPWMILGPALQPIYQKYLPGWIYERLDVCAHGWEFRAKREYHDRLGDVFVVVTPDECSVWVADPTIGQTVLQRRIEFPQAPITARMVGFFGSNVFCANGDEWKRHRRMFAANLDERISRTVWTETKQQALDMFKYMLDNPGNQTLDGLKSVAMNVIGQAGFSQKEDWTPGLRARLGKATTGKAAYFETMSLVTQMFLEAALLPKRLMKLQVMPRALQQLGYHMERTPEYIQDVLNEERKTTGKASGRRDNFLSLLLQLSDEDRRSGQGQFSLSDDEISGSLFVFTTAGFETTANTMGYSVSFLAACPEWQDWVREELQALPEDPSTWNYEEVFPKCRRTLALMLETLRLFPPVLHTTRAVLEPQELTDATGKSHLLTPPMDLFVCQLSMHLDRTIWGEDANQFNPGRWIDASGELITPEKGTYLPWSGGPRICPGVKMSQVEFVATIATLFRNGKCEPLPTDGVDSPEILRKRLLGLVWDSLSKLTLQIRDPDAVQLRWTAV